MKTHAYLKSLNMDHIFRMTDDTGMLQHSICGVPDLSKGYTADDNARALIMAVKLYEMYREKKVERLINKYLAFLCYAQNTDGKFRNFMSYSREFLEDEGSEDCFGRCLWALCYAFENAVTPEYVKKTAGKLIEKALPNCMGFKSPRAKAYVIIGLNYLKTEKSKGLISKLAVTLAQQYEHYRDRDWHWFEDSMTYCNAVLPRAMFVAYSAVRKEEYKTIGVESLKFLESKSFHDGYFKPIGCNGWLYKGEQPVEFDEQPVEACETMFAYINAFEISGNKKLLDQAKTCFLWYFGKNSKNLCLIDKETGGCCDGITPDGLNLNQGAESILSVWMAYMEIKKYLDVDASFLNNRLIREVK